MDLNLDLPGRDLDLEELRAIAEAVAANRGAWEPKLERDPQRRTSVILHRRAHLSLMAIQWMREDHDTGFHDHGRSRGAVAVAEGGIRHEFLSLRGDEIGALVTAGDSFVFDIPEIHRMRYDTNAGPTVTVHGYSPELEFTGQYDEGEDGHLRRLRARATEQLQPRM